ncbi:MAG: VWA domain-containing protein [Sedimentisphaerales bacterium]|nr:VWA domain-containing protein [Sedimentisphaerales bacterium]
MEWLTPLIGLYAAAAAVPLLLLLYFLKLKRRETAVSSTLLWKRAVRDLQVNAPFQRLRRNLLLLLQLLALTAMLLALAGPVLALRRGPGRRYVLLIDRSASMSATDVEPSRLAEARKQAKVFVESMRSGSLVSLRDQADYAMVIAFDGRAKVMCNFTADKPQLMAAIDAIEAGHGVSRLGEAVTVARAFAQGRTGEGNGTGDETPARLVLFSDGRIEDLDSILIASDELVFHSIGESGTNVAITAMDARRSYEQPEQVEVFVSLANYGSEPVTRDVQLGVNGDVRAVRSATIPGAEAASGTSPFKPGKVAVSFSLSYAGAGVLDVRQVGDDALACDDSAWAVLEPPRRLSVLLVTQGNPVLESALQACPLARLDPCTPAGFDAMDPAVFALERPYDLIVLDNHVPAHQPRCQYLVFGAPPNGIDVNAPREVEKQIVVDWRTQHPVLQYVNLTNLFAARSRQLELPRDADVLAEFNESPAVAFLRREGRDYLLVAFDVMQSNWPFEPGFVLFCYNALNFLGTQLGGAEPQELEVNQPIRLVEVPVESVATITGPDGSGVEVQPDADGTVRFPATQRVGVYAADVPGRPPRFYAVNLTDESESWIEPQKEMRFSSTTVAAAAQTVQRANVPLWPVLVLVALLVACLEWLVYNHKVRI